MICSRTSAWPTVPASPTTGGWSPTGSAPPTIGSHSARRGCPTASVHASFRPPRCTWACTGGSGECLLRCCRRWPMRGSPTAGAGCWASRATGCPASALTRGRARGYWAVMWGRASQRPISPGAPWPNWSAGWTLNARACRGWESRPRRWEPEPLRWLGVRASRALLGVADHREQRTGRRERLASGIATLLRGGH